MIPSVSSGRGACVFVFATLGASVGAIGSPGHSQEAPWGDAAGTRLKLMMGALRWGECRGPRSPRGPRQPFRCRDQEARRPRRRDVRGSRRCCPCPRLRASPPAPPQTREHSPQKGGAAAPASSWRGPSPASPLLTEDGSAGS